MCVIFAYFITRTLSGNTITPPPPPPPQIPNYCLNNCGQTFNQNSFVDATTLPNSWVPNPSTKAFFPKQHKCSTAVTLDPSAPHFVPSNYTSGRDLEDPYADVCFFPTFTSSMSVLNPCSKIFVPQQRALLGLHVISVIFVFIFIVTSFVLNILNTRGKLVNWGQKGA